MGVLTMCRQTTSAGLISSIVVIRKLTLPEIDGQANDDFKGLQYQTSVEVYPMGHSNTCSGGRSSYCTVDMPKPQQLSDIEQTIFFGANDATVPGHNQNVPLDEYKSNLKAIISHPLITAHPTKFLLLTPPPVNEQQFDQLDRLADRTRQYADALKAVGAELGLPVADLWTAFMTKAGWKEGDPLLGKRGVKGSSKLIALLSDGENCAISTTRIDPS